MVIRSEFSDINLSLLYSEKDGRVELVCESAGNPINPLEEGILEDDLGLRLIRSLSESVVYQYENGRNILKLEVKV